MYVSIYVPFLGNSFKEFDDHLELNGVIMNKPFVEKPFCAEDHNIHIYYHSKTGGGSQRLFRKVKNQSSKYFSESSVRKSGSYMYEEFLPTDGTDVKVGLFFHSCQV